MNPDSLTFRTATIAITYWTVVALWPGPLPAEKPMFRASLNVGLRAPSYLTGIFPFELRAVASEGDRLDLLNHLAAHAEADGRLDEALRLTDQGLARNPANLTALLTRRRVHAMQGLCELAAHDLELAAETVESGRDTGNHGPRLDPGARRANAEVFRRTMSAIRCP